jgi:hypothetical protein
VGVMKTLARIIHAAGINYNLVTISPSGMMPDFPLYSAAL